CSSSSFSTGGTHWPAAEWRPSSRSESAVGMALVANRLLKKGEDGARRLRGWMIKRARNRSRSCFQRRTNSLQPVQSWLAKDAKRFPLERVAGTAALLDGARSDPVARGLCCAAT